MLLPMQCVSQLHGLASYASYMGTPRILSGDRSWNGVTYSFARMVFLGSTILERVHDALRLFRAA